MLRYLVLNHLIHHRGQLSVYLRLQDVDIPAIYGPSADEGRFPLTCRARLSRAHICTVHHGTSSKVTRETERPQAFGR